MLSLRTGWRVDGVPFGSYEVPFRQEVRKKSLFRQQRRCVGAAGAGALCISCATARTTHPPPDHPGLC